MRAFSILALAFVVTALLVIAAHAQQLQPPPSCDSRLTITSAYRGIAEVDLARMHDALVKANARIAELEAEVRKLAPKPEEPRP